MKRQGKVTLVGSGPGDAGLLTKKAENALKEAEVIVYDALVSLEILSLCPGKAEWINVGKRANHHRMSQEDINELLCQKAKEGKYVVRLKGGDPFVFGRGGEELELLSREGIPFEVIPGITSAVAVAAYNGIPVTHRDYTSSFHVITGHKKKNGVLDIDFKALVEMDATLVFLMGVSELNFLCEKLMENGMNPDTPAAVLEKGTTCRQRRVIATVSTLFEESEKEKMKSPAVIIIGKVCNLERKFAWFEKKPLFGCQILVTRPENKMENPAKELRSLGAQVIGFPTIKIEPLQTAEEKKRFKAAWKEMISKECPVCITFTSPQGVKQFFSLLREEETDLRKLCQKPEITFAVIGSGTKEELKKYHIYADYMPEHYSAKDLGICLANALKKETEIYIFRAEKGSPYLLEELEKAGMTCFDIPIYRTEYQNHPELSEKINDAFLNQEIDGVTFTSASTVRGFLENFKDLDFTKIKAYCIGEQTACEAKKAGMQVEISKEATMDGVIELIKNDLILFTTKKCPLVTSV